MQTVPSIAIHQVRPASAPVAKWLSALLQPAAAACRMKKAPPVELRPTGAWGGWCNPPDRAPDGRVTLSSTAAFWTREAIITMWCHEAAHRFQAEPFGVHDAAFYCTLLVLLTRCDLAGVTKHAALQMSRYDLQDTPPVLTHLPDRGLGRAISWATSVADEFVETELAEIPAEEAAQLIATRYAAWLDELTAEPAALAAQQASALRIQRRHEEVVSELRDKLFARTLYLVLTGLFAVALVIVLLKLA